ncbi:zinc ribbon domain-containing protein [Candidatus Woesearchaeota archaeon]|nr:zinc ribbon domain-containing protein [Candidatus Woesearchaeota archaeon]
MKKHILALILAIFLIVTIVSAQPQYIIANSKDWRDVYSTIEYANLQQKSYAFLTSTRHGPIILNAVPLNVENITAVSSRSEPYVVGYDTIIESRGYNAQEIVTRQANIELARELIGTISNFIIIDDSYGYNAISVAPYAAKTNAYVLFADRDNIDDVVDFLADASVNDLLIYGQVDREVKTALEFYSPTIIHEGDRFDNNIAIVKEYIKLTDAKQTIITNGEFIEASIMSGNDPVLFLGRTNVPDKIRDYIEQSDLQVAVLIGNELVGAATFIRRQIGIPVFVKFGQGARIPSGTISSVEDLDRFYLPRYVLQLNISSVEYNQATGLLEVSYQNLEELAAYFKSTITVDADGQEFVLRKIDERTGQIDEEDNPIFIDGLESKTIQYQSEEAIGDFNTLIAKVFTIYGEAPGSLENILEATLTVSIVRVFDDSQIEIKDLVYDKSGEFLVTIENTGEVDAYVFPEIINLIVNGQDLIVGADGTTFIKVGKQKKIGIEAELQEEDFDDNQELTVRAYHGMRENALVRVTYADFLFKLAGIDYVFWILLVLLAILLFLIYKSIKKKCPNCETKNHPKRKTCKKCGHHIRKH